jgi:glutamate dehydrogenase/leucine dehydrogenase
MYQDFNLLEKSPEEFANSLLNSSIETGYIIYKDGNLIGSNQLFQKLADNIIGLDDFSKHEAIFFKVDSLTKCIYLVFVHSTIRGQAQGGTRLKYKGYETLKEVIDDGMRLSEGMTDKNSISQIWWGGGKAIICPFNQIIFDELNEQKIGPNGRKIFTVDGLKDFTENAVLSRKNVFIRYGEFVASLGGVYVAAEDMFTDKRDMKDILSVCRYVTCLPEAVGGSGNPSKWTANGVFQAMRATVEHFERKTNLNGMTIAIQGLGNVGKPLAEFVLGDGANIIVYDEDKELCQKIAETSDKVKIVDTEMEIYTTNCDIFAPCAIGAVLGKINRLNCNTIDMLSCKYVIGAANNQLVNFDEDYKKLNAKGIIYLPDFFINRMGIINCADEQYGLSFKYLDSQVKKVYDDPVNGTKHLLEESKRINKPPQEIALEWAKKWGQERHPIWKDRGAELIETLIEKGTEFWSA